MNISTIQRGSLFLGDDFIQAMSYNTPARLSGFALLNLPAWRSDSMCIVASELGLPAGVVSPNEILPAMFVQYWQNLCGYARQYHASIGLNEDIEDFAEQAFWKMMYRLCKVQSIQDLSAYVVAKSTDVLTNTNSVDGNMYTEILLNVNALTKTQTAKLVHSKPAYMQTIGKLPSVQNTNILKGHSKAVYDSSLAYYDMQESQCVKLSMSDADNASADFSYNAILLYYELGSIEQVAGLYFPNAFVENNGTYALPKINKSSDTSFGYSINVSYNAGGSYAYNAANADQGTAMQVYNNMYKNMLSSNMQLNAIAKRMLEQEQELQSIKSMLADGYITKLSDKVDKLTKQIATTYKGSVSTNKLLEMFVAAKQNSGTLNLTAMLSDLSQSITSRDIKVTNDIGAYNAGDTITAGTSLTDILAGILKQHTVVSYVQPYGKLTVNGKSDTVYVNYKSVTSITVKSELVQGDAGAFTLPATLTLYANGSKKTAQIAGVTGDATFTGITANNAMHANLTVNYAEGQLKPGDTTGDDKVFAGLLSLNVRIIPVFDAYITQVKLLEQLRGTISAVSNMNKVKSTELGPNYQLALAEYVVLVIPEDVDCPIVNEIAGTASTNIYGVQYTAYAVKGSQLILNTTNLF